MWGSGNIKGNERWIVAGVEKYWIANISHRVEKENAKIVSHGIKTDDCCQVRKSVDWEQSLNGRIQNASKLKSSTFIFLNVYFHDSSTKKNR